MNKFSKNIFDFIINSFPKLKYSVEFDSDLLIMKIISPYESKLGGIIIQTTIENQIWLRIFPSHSGYSIDQNEELKTIISGVIEDEILWVIGFEDDSWIETTLVKSVDDIETELGITYNVYSWSGNLDTTFIT